MLLSMFVIIYRAMKYLSNMHIAWKGRNYFDCHLR